MKKRSPLVLECLNAGLVYGSKEFKAAYQQLLRKKNPEKYLKKWREYAKKKGKDWNNKRVEVWRKKNPEKWKSLMEKASKNGLHKRFYDKHRERIVPIKREEQKNARRKHPAFGLRFAIAKFRRGEITQEDFIDYCSRAIAKLDAGSDKK